MALSAVVNPSLQMQVSVLLRQPGLDGFKRRRPGPLFLELGHKANDETGIVMETDAERLASVIFGSCSHLKVA